MEGVDYKKLSEEVKKGSKLRCQKNLTLTEPEFSPFFGEEEYAYFNEGQIYHVIELEDHLAIYMKNGICFLPYDGRRTMTWEFIAEYFVLR